MTAPPLPRPPHDLAALRAGLPAAVAARLVSAAELRRRPVDRRPGGPGGTALPTGIPGLDALLGGGLPLGRLVEITGGASSGRFALGLAVLAAVTGRGETAALVDLDDHLDPRAAEEAGIDLSRLLWLRPRRLKEALAAAEMTAGAGFRLVTLDLGTGPLSRRQLGTDAAPGMRLAREVRSQESFLFVSSPIPVAGPAAEISLCAGRPHGLWVRSGNVPLLGGLTTSLLLTRRRGGASGTASSLAYALPAPAGSLLPELAQTTLAAPAAPAASAAPAHTRLLRIASA